MAKTIDQIAKEELEKQNSRDSEFGGTSESSDQSVTDQEETFEADAVVTPSLERVIETDFDFNAAINKIDKDYEDLQKRIDEPGLFLAEPGDYQLQLEKNKKIVEAKLK